MHTFGPAIINRAESAEVIDRIVAVVNDDIITLFDLNQAFAPYAEKIKTTGYSSEQEHAMILKVRESLLNRLIDQKIEDQEIKRYKINVSEKDIDKTIERIKKTNHYTDEELRTALSRDGLTMQDYRERIKEQGLRAKLVNLEVKSKIVITDKDMRAYYDSHPETYGGEKKYHLRNIIMEVPLLAGEDEKLKIKAKMEAVLAKLKDGEPFETMAATYSTSSFASGGGDLGTFTLKELSPNLREAIKGLKAGEFTPVLDTEQGYQIFLVEEIIQKEGQPFEKVAPGIERTIFNEIVEKRFHSWLEKLRKRSHIKIIQP